MRVSNYTHMVSKTGVCVGMKRVLGKKNE